MRDRVKNRATTERSVTELTGPQLPTGKIAKVLFSGEDDLETFWFPKTKQRAQTITGLNTVNHLSWRVISAPKFRT